MKTVLITSAAALALSLPAFAQEENAISMDEVPEAALAAAQENAPEGITEFESVQIDDDGGTETYEFAATKEDGMAIEVDVLADGTLEEIEEEVAMDAVPQPVSAALDGELPGFEPSFVEKSTREDGSLIVYEFEGQHEGQEIDVEIDEDGSNLVRNEDAAG